MSFSWSAGDIVAAPKLVQQIGSALKDSGGASSEFQDTLSFPQTLSPTLRYLNLVQATPLDPDLAENLRELCEHIREGSSILEYTWGSVPFSCFLEDGRGSVA